MSFSDETFDEEIVIETQSSFGQAVSDMFADPVSRFVVALAVIVPAAIVGACFLFLGSSGTTVQHKSVVQYLNDGLVFADKGAYLSAEYNYMGAALNDPTDAHGYKALAYYDLGVCFQRTAFPSVAIAYYEKSLQLNAANAAGWYNLAIAQASTPTLALADYNHALTINPTYPQALLNSGILMYDAGQQAAGVKRINEAIRYDAALKSRVPTNINLSA